MSRAADRFDITLIDAFLRDRLDEEASESFELRMLGDADFALSWRSAARCSTPWMASRPAPPARRK